MHTIVTTIMGASKKSKKNSGRSEMIYFEDRGTVLDAPIDAV
jgi:hypothetical protein